MDYNPPGSSVHGILQARILEYVAIAFSKREAVGEGQYVRIGEGGVPCNQALTLQEVFCYSRASAVIIKGFSAFLDMRRCRIGIMKSVPENIQLSKDLPYQGTDCLTPPRTPSAGVEGQ